MQKSAHTPTNQCCSALQQCQKIGGGLFIAHQQLAEAVEPRVRAFNHPTARALPLPAGAGFFSALSHMRCVTALLHGLRGGTPRIAFVRTQVLPAAAAGFGAHDYNAVQSGFQQFDIMSVGPADDNGQRNAAPSTSKLRLLPFFPPISGVIAHRFPGQRSFALRPINALPLPGNPLHFIILGQTGLP